MLIGFMAPMVTFWLCAMIIFLIVEGLTVGLVSIWFAGGALIALIAAACRAPVWLQLVLFVIVTAILLLALRPLSRGRLKTRTTATNADRSIGREAIVTETIDNLRGAGAVKLDGLVWTARSTDGTPIEQGCHVIVDRIEGVKLLVSATPEEKE